MAFQRLTLLAITLGLCSPQAARAGMPVVTFTDVARMRLQSISFFLVVFLGCAWLVQRIWNGLSRDFPRVPKLSYGRALGVTTLWGLLFLLVLSMISGARELMTPGAWKKEGLTYKLAETAEPREVSVSDAARRTPLERLRVLLWAYAEPHDGAFPRGQAAPGIPDDAWLLPGLSGLRYVYVSGQKLEAESKTPHPLVYEPDLYGADRLALMTTGEIEVRTLEQIRAQLERKEP